MRVVVLRLGSSTSDPLQAIRKRLTATFPETTCTLSQQVMPLPKEAYNSRRQQYNAPNILTRIRDFTNDFDFDRVLGVASADLYASRLNFVFGQAECPGKVAVISLCRLKPEFYGHRSDRALFDDRCAKESVHETGHTLGLPHCRDPSCVMSFSNSIQMVDTKDCNFCETCRIEVLRRIPRVYTQNVTH